MFLGKYDYTVFLTYFNLLIGFFGIFIIIEDFNNLNYAVICLLLSGICDMFDGIVSNLKKERTIEEIRYGFQIDSLADIVSFGILPIIIGIRLFRKFLIFPFFKIFFFFNTSLYILTILIRLAYFNVLTENFFYQKKSKKKVNSEIFVGLPVTFVSFFFPIFILIKRLFFLEKDEKYLFLFPVIYSFSFLFLAFLFIFEHFHFKKPKKRFYFLFFFIIIIFIYYFFGFLIN
ncbi:MAG: CDP-alcohol phosphatidyltransferase family protein [Candidatus Phytoplasma stylosanthis]|uniref:CDP-alcohol phosphatidyltransferase family protein n=1 Tax=Candidatus Phytoplasma stylosanthis TaxID=2798314 RepID=UPI00293969FE|nr:CDP-alcohol phosphatidyltransferase family protein [Candidatus Phytoplasma stylosanthis]MDV3168048.1 CDP-alcohol phosphatidyltransferase family protein [Candidatus Phytoplasma stylosanthis]MDV3170990.1 CDP-alcohol phosphatidyltransferase family protein [Candidatus Phytoplasma stylosanthis]MDV3173769.1 CDP-alcohol phosphatidyltransferase family protein [Candidatus Phytoplasma stylosanthis]MDV3174306.1 CDP-alcohol phosphatidyltransferase family protein [Candidatus Phytoplasma stylosanthis]MDV